MVNPFVGNIGANPALEAARQRQLAQMMLARSLRGAVGRTGQDRFFSGLQNLSSALVGGILDRRAGRAEQKVLDQKQQAAARENEVLQSLFGTAPQDVQSQGLIGAGQQSVVPQTEAQSGIDAATISLTADDVDLLSRIGSAEARQLGQEGRQAVIATVLNRVASPEFPNTVRGVLSQKGQFEPVSRFGGIDRLPTVPVDQRAADEAFLANFTDPTSGALFFANPVITNQRGTSFPATRQGAAPTLSQGRGNVRHDFFRSFDPRRPNQPVPSFNVALAGGDASNLTPFEQQVATGNFGRSPLPANVDTPFTPGTIPPQPNAFFEQINASPSAVTSVPRGARVSPTGAPPPEVSVIPDGIGGVRIVDRVTGTTPAERQAGQQLAFPGARQFAENQIVNAGVNMLEQGNQPIPTVPPVPAAANQEIPVVPGPSPLTNVELPTRLRGLRAADEFFQGPNFISPANPFRNLATQAPAVATSNQLATPSAAAPVLPVQTSPLPPTPVASAQPAPVQAASTAGGLPSPQQLIRALPFLTGENRTLAMQLLREQLKRSGPQRGINVDGRLVNPTTGEVIADLREPERQTRVLTQEEEVELGLNPDNAYQVAPDGSIKQIGGGGVKVNIDNRTTPAFDKKFSEQNAEAFFERRKGALDAAASLKSTAEARQLLDSGVITGTGAEFLVGIGKALQQVGFNVNDDALANTEAFVGTRAQEVGRIIKLFGAGTGLSDADREFATKAAAGKITLTEKSIRRILDINERASRNVIALFNKDAERIPEGLSPFPVQVEVPDINQPAERKRLKFNPDTGELE